MIPVTQPYLPPLEEFTPYLEQIWKNKWLTNNGPFHQQFEKALAEYLGVQYISVFANGTLALLTALQALEIKGEVITTPYSFVATTNALWWNGIKPVFADIEDDFFNLDPNKVEAAITDETTAIMPVHVYGNPCDDKALRTIAEKYNLKLLYDAAHTFGVKENGLSLANMGDLSILSFHATKVFNTFEGGAIVCRSKEMKQRIDDLKNFGFRDELTVIAPGINSKMNEVQAAFGLLQLKYVDEAIAKRKEIAHQYRLQLNGIEGIRFLQDIENVNHNYSYFPILIDANKYGKTRDEVYNLFKANDIYARRYFYPLISQFPMYSELESARTSNLPIATRIANQVLCLPIYPDLALQDVSKIVSLLMKK